MQTNTQVPSDSNKSKWIGWTITGLVSLFLAFDAIAKIAMVQKVVEATASAGYPETTVFGIGLILLIATVIYLIPLTSILGAILLTAYLGGATATHVRLQEPYYFAVIFGILVWLGLYLRDKQLRMLVPFKRSGRLEKTVSK